MRARQLSARGGELEVELRGPDPLAEDGRVWIRGRAVTTLVGRLAFAPESDH